MMTDTSGAKEDCFSVLGKIMKGLKLAQTEAGAILPDTHSTAAKPESQRAKHCQSSPPVIETSLSNQWFAS